MDRQLAKIIRTKLDELMKNGIEVGGETMNVTVGNCTFNSDDCTFKITIAKEGSMSKEERDLARVAGIYEVEPFKVNTLADGTSYKLVGFNTRARKKPFIIEKIGTDAKYVIDEYLARKYFGKEAS